MAWLIIIIINHIPLWVKYWEHWQPCGHNLISSKPQHIWRTLKLSAILTVLAKKKQLRRIRETFELSANLCSSKADSSLTLWFDPSESRCWSLPCETSCGFTVETTVTNQHQLQASRMETVRCGSAWLWLYLRRSWPRPSIYPINIGKKTPSFIQIGTVWYSNFM